MKTEDLMIGDWYYWEAEGKMYPYQITAEDFVKGEIPNFQPIPLTPEILEKNGFEPHRDIASNAFHCDFGRIGVLELIEFEGRWEGHVITQCGDSFYDYEIFYFLSIHELQHALRLCGIEKEIVL